jgi:hypothetical protein
VVTVEFLHNAVATVTTVTTSSSVVCQMKINRSTIIVLNSFKVNNIQKELEPDLTDANVTACDGSMQLLKEFSDWLI